MKTKAIAFTSAFIESERVKLHFSVLIPNLRYLLEKLQDFEMAASSFSEPTEISDDIKKRIFVVKRYWLHQRSPSAAITDYNKELSRKNSPTPKTVSNIAKKFHDYGTVHDLRKGVVGPKTTMVTSCNIERVDEYFQQNPTQSPRHASAELEIPTSSLQRIIKSKLKRFPYKIQVFQELSDFDMHRRLTFAQTMLDKFDNREIDLEKIWLSDKAHFWLTGFVNKQNHRFWARENPRIFSTTTMKPK